MPFSDETKHEMTQHINLIGTRRCVFFAFFFFSQSIGTLNNSGKHIEEKKLFILPLWNGYIIRDFVKAHKWQITNENEMTGAKRQLQIKWRKKEGEKDGEIILHGFQTEIKLLWLPGRVGKPPEQYYRWSQNSPLLPTKNVMRCGRSSATNEIFKIKRNDMADGRLRCGSAFYLFALSDRVIHIPIHTFVYLYMYVFVFGDSVSFCVAWKTHFLKRILRRTE